jgi:alanyl-tRNA synthetase
VEYCYLATSKTEDTRGIAKSLNEKFQGKGGGRPECVQGKITANCEADITNFIKEGCF